MVDYSITYKSYRHLHSGLQDVVYNKVVEYSDGTVVYYLGNTKVAVLEGSIPLQFKTSNKHKYDL